MKKIFVSILMVLLLVSGCSNKDNRSDDIVILFTNDIHSAIDEGITLAGVAGYKEYMQTKSKYVTLVDCGDAIQGTALGLASSGEVAIDAMNVANYDLCIFGNHEFDYGIDRLSFLINKANAEYINANILYTGNEENIFNQIKPYKIINYGKTKVAFIGITTPDTLNQSSPKNFKEENEYVYDFNASNILELIQNYVDEVKTKGADYVVVLGHLGINSESEYSDYSADYIINNTHGIDVLLDGHSHSLYQRFCTENDNGDYVVSAQTGTKLQALGQLVIDKNGLITVSTISDVVRVDEQAKEIIDSYIAGYDTLLDEVIANVDYNLSSFDEDGIRMVRNRETNIGNFVSDAYRNITGADISYQNGGGIRSDINSGEVKLRDCISVTPYGNQICVIEVTGQEIIDLIEFWCKDCTNVYKANGNAVNENGSFPSMSGIKFTINTSKKANIEVDDKNNLVSIIGNRRISDVLIEENGNYVPVELDKTYTLASIDYVLKNGGSGTELFLKNHNIIMDNVSLDYEALIYYLRDVLNGDISKYKEVDNRIKIE